jgi:hypothetical protein
LAGLRMDLFARIIAVNGTPAENIRNVIKAVFTMKRWEGV